MELNIYPGSIIDEASSTVTYIGTAAMGVTTSQALWKILRITSSASTPPIITVFEYADGNTDYDNIWNNRASLTYSR